MLLIETSCVYVLLHRCTWRWLCCTQPLDLERFVNCLRHLIAFLAILAYFCSSHFGFVFRGSNCCSMSFGSNLDWVSERKSKCAQTNTKTKIGKSRQLNLIFWLWMCVTFYAHYTFKVCAHNRFTHKWYRAQHRISRMFMRLSESMSAGMQTIELSASIVAFCRDRMCVCAHAPRDSIDQCNVDCTQLHKIALVQIKKKKKPPTCTYAILSPIL